MPDDSREVLRKGVKWLPDGFYVTSADGRIAENKIGRGHETLVRDQESGLWKLGQVVSYYGENRRMFAMQAGKNGSGTHYLWDRTRELWVPIPGPSKPPPEGMRLSSMLPGFVEGFTAEGFIQYQWNEDEQRWIRVDEVPSGYREQVSRDLRLEAHSLDDFKKVIFWDEKQKTWIDPATGQPPMPRPPPPTPAVVDEEWRESDPDIAFDRDQNRYFLWTTEKQRWVMMTDLPEGFRRGYNPRQAHAGEGTALDRWIEWDSSKEKWVDFGPDRHFLIQGRVG